MIFFTMGKLRNPEETNLTFARWMLEKPNSATEQWIVGMTIQTPNSVVVLLNATANFLDYQDSLIGAGNSFPVWCVVRKDQRQVVANWCNQNRPAARISAFGEHMMFWEQSKRFNQELSNFQQTIHE